MVRFLPEIIRLKAIPIPKSTRSNVIVSAIAPVFKGEKASNYVCGYCGIVLAENVKKGAR